MEVFMQAPQITLGDKTYTARKLKMGSWRAVAKMQKEVGNMGQAEAMMDESVMEKMAGVIVAVFNNPEVTAELILDELDLCDFTPTIQAVSGWVNAQVSGKVDEFPPSKNAQTTVQS